eukprot:XP_011670189.1 PREDICTED: EGF-like repeat and discoidin I-like domain-containing protein 3 [Strongylocentrotus purpuratus]
MQRDQHVKSFHDIQTEDDSRNTYHSGVCHRSGPESGTIPDSSLTASSEYTDNHAPKRARLNLARVGLLRGAWSARVNDINQWIQVFDGNSDEDTVVNNTLPVPQDCRYVRLLPLTWQRHVSLRMELYGTAHVTDVIALGLESGTIPDSSLTASSMWKANHGPKRARLNLVQVRSLSGAWSAGVNDVNQWIQIGNARSSELLSTMGN